MRDQTYTMFIKARTRHELEDKYLAFQRFFTSIVSNYWATFYQLNENGTVYYAYAITIEK